MRGLIGLSAVVVGCLLVACSGGAPKDDAPDFETTSPNMNEGKGGAADGDASLGDPPSDPPAADDSDAGAEAAAPAPNAYEGTLAATSKVPFGGSPYCNYAVTLKNVVIDLGIRDSGDVASATVKDTMNEELVGSCPYKAAAPNDQQFALKTATVTTSGSHLEFTGAKTNQPATALVVDLVATSNGYDASLTWTRTDQKAPLAWTVTAKIPLTMK